MLTAWYDLQPMHCKFNNDAVVQTHTCSCVVNWRLHPKEAHLPAYQTGGLARAVQAPLPEETNVRPRLSATCAASALACDLPVLACFRRSTRRTGKCAYYACFCRTLSATTAFTVRISTPKFCRAVSKRPSFPFLDLGSEYSFSWDPLMQYTKYLLRFKPFALSFLG